ncbi:hypothetical protein SAMN05421805_102132 [Saccharopolyspora antimicrobica]|uniref:Antitoxin Phd_YefM, type II toxin-antitoxin system n=1 Tax=Saccharopolyspora antimicrobica TaxID=455193 RepID=A0A1I4VD00_9PSEU|nr:hypothetical protein [Saccharopolyspora antimicrobica]RKT86236.1 hypothetical protein ATL45_4598 [Saccharopolyspora antimicrobica]SFM99037.1 hypothetical protein SAMN05421805_102132 [Saccharopolyspora antimicrobica]
MREVQWSEVQRDPKGVAELVDQGDVRIRRRDGAPLVLTREDRAAGVSEGAVIAARAVRAAFDRFSPDELIDVLSEEFPWAALLPSGARSEFALDFAQTFRASAELGSWVPLQQTLREWKATALVYTDPELVKALTEPVTEDFGPVPPPEGGDE